MARIAGGLLVALLVLASCATPPERPRPGTAGTATPQAPGWTQADLDFFLHGSMSTEVVPERVLRAFVRIYPDLFPRADLSHFGLIPDPAFGWPVGLSRRAVPHLGGLSALGVNCASCHVGEIEPPRGGAPVRVLGMTSHFDAEAYFGTVIVATFRTADPPAMRRFVSAYLDDAAAEPMLAREWARQEPRILAAITADPFAAKGVAAGALHAIAPDDVRLDRASLEAGVDLAARVRAMLKLFHNMRAALHVPDAIPDTTPPPSGPGRNDAFGLLSAVLLGVPQPYAPVKYGLAWNLEEREWVHWDGNSRSPIGRNLLAALGLGAPLDGKRGVLDFRAVQRHTDLTERIRAPRYPFAIDEAAARRGESVYRRSCASCHDGAESDPRLHAIDKLGTDPVRARNFTIPQAERFNRFLTELQSPGYRPSKVPGLRGTQKYWAPSLAGVWARSPYLHNGSVRTMHELLAPPAARAKSFRRGARQYDAERMGYVDDGPYTLNTDTPGNSAAGHEYGTDLTTAQKRDLIQFLKTI